MSDTKLYNIFVKYVYLSTLLLFGVSVAKLLFVNYNSDKRKFILILYN
jgi:hypothetical protein